jgi:hypothetical protein
LALITASATASAATLASAPHATAASAPTTPAASTATSTVDDVTAAKSAYTDVDYPACKERAQAALAGSGTVPQRVDAWRLLGLCSAALNDVDTARDAFRHMLLIERDAKLPEGLSPRFTSSFREAKGSLVGVGPLLTLDKDSVDGPRRTVRITVMDDDSLVQRVVVRAEGAGQKPAVRASPKMELDVPGDVDVDVVGLDKAGGDIATLHFASAHGPQLDDKPDVSKGKIVAEDNGVWWIVGGVVAGTVVVGGGVALAVTAALAPPSKVNLKTAVVFGN